MVRTALSHPAKRHFGVGWRNAPDVPFSIGGFRGVCHAGVICLYWVGSTTGVIFERAYRRLWKGYVCKLYILDRICIDFRNFYICALCDLGDLGGCLVIT